MARGWARSTVTDPVNFGTVGWSNMIGLHPGQTVLRSYWNIGLVGTYTNPGQYPPGGSILRVGMSYNDPLVEIPTPISAPDADWMDIETIHPRVVLASAVDNIWQLNWDFVKDESVKSQRKNDTAEEFVLQVSWEFATFEPAVGFNVPWWTASVDAYINTPDTLP